VVRSYRNSGARDGLWDLYLKSESWWAQQTGWSVYGMIRVAGKVLHDSRLKQIAAQHEENLAKLRYGRFATHNALFNSLFMQSACKFPTYSAP
jgi:hypothetical protein